MLLWVMLFIDFYLEVISYNLNIKTSVKRVMS